MAIKIDQFSGKAPKVSDHLLRDNMATVATNLRIDSGAITALKGVTQVSTTTSTHRSIYRYEAPEDAFTWLGWTAQNVNVIRSPVPNDRYNRIYITGNGEPKYLYYNTVAAAPSSEYLLGVPRPTAPPGTTATGPTASTLTGGKTFDTTTTALTIVNTLGAAVIDNTGTTVSAGAFKLGWYYTIAVATGTTNDQWNTIAGTTLAPQTYIVGSTFTCANIGAGLGTGTATSSPSISRNTSGADWAVGVSSVLPLLGSCVLRFSLTISNASTIIGLNIDTNPAAKPGTIDWAVQGDNNGSYKILNNSKPITFGSIAANKYTSSDVFEIEYVGTTINVSLNGNIVYSTYDPINKANNKTVVAGQSFYMVASLKGTASGSGTFSQITNIEFGQYNIAALTATISAGSFIPLTEYVILSVGTTTDWNAVAGTTGKTYATGTQFTAATVGSGNGTATTASIFKAGGMTLNSNTDNVLIEGTSVAKTKGAVGWNAQATSSESFVGPCVVKFQFGSMTSFAAAGLNTPPLTGVGKDSLDFCFASELVGGVLHAKIYEGPNTTAKADGGVITLETKFQIECTATGSIVYSIDGKIIYTSLVTNNLTKNFYFDSSLYKIGALVTNIQLGTNLTNSDVLSAATADLTLKDRSYVYTYVSPLGEEGPPSPVSSKISVNDLQTVILTFPSITSEITPKDGNGTAYSAPYNLSNGLRRIYRTAVGTTSTEFLRVGDCPITTDSFGDSVLDVGLTEPLPSLNWFPPPLDMKSVTSTPNGFIVGYSGNSLCVSEAMFPHAFNPFNQLGFTGNVTGIASSGDSLVVFTDEAPYLVTGSTPGTLTAIRIDHQQTCANKASIVNMGGYVLFASPDGLCSVTANDMAIETQNYLTRDQWQAYSPSTMRGYLYEGVYIGFSDTKQFMFDRRQDPAVLTDISGFTVSSGFNDLSQDKLYVLDNAGHISTWETGSNQTYIWKSKLAREATAICPAALRLYATGDVIFKLYADGTLVFTTTVTNSNVVRLPSGYRAKEFQIEVSGSGVLQSFAIASSVSELQ